MLWRIGSFVADSDTDTLTGGAEPRKLERRAMEVLLYLAQRSGQVVSRDDLIRDVWDRVAVTDHAVAMVISQLRQAFNDDARAPSYIETITKRGYRLIAPAAVIEAAAEPARSEPSAELQSGSQQQPPHP